MESVGSPLICACLSVSRDRDRESCERLIGIDLLRVALIKSIAVPCALDLLIAGLCSNSVAALALHCSSSTAYGEVLVVYSCYELSSLTVAAVLSKETDCYFLAGSNCNVLGSDNELLINACRLCACRCGCCRSRRCSCAFTAAEYSNSTGLDVSIKLDRIYAAFNNVESVNIPSISSGSCSCGNADLELG